MKTNSHLFWIFHRVEKRFCRKSGACFAVLFLCTGFLHLLRADINLIQNGDFEQSEGGVVKGWSAQSGNMEPTTDAEFSHGKFSLHLKGDATKVSVSTSKAISQVQPGKKYALSFYAKSPVTGQIVTPYYYTPPKFHPHWYRKKSFLVSETWTKYVYPMLFPPTGEWANRPLTIEFQIPKGEVYLDDVVLEEDASASAGTISNQPVKLSRKNLMANSGFELGWLNWGLAGYRKEGAVYEEPEIPSAIDFNEKYEGTASMRIEPNTNLISIRYPIQHSENYTLSFYVKGKPGPVGSDRNTSFFVLTPTWKKFSKTLVVGQDIGSDWKRFSIPFNVPDQGSDFRNTVYVRIDSKDNILWVDGVQIEKGKMTEYDPGVEVGFLTKNKYGLFSHGVPESVDMAISSSLPMPDHLWVNLQARDIYSNVIWEKKIEIPQTSKQFVTLPVTLDNATLGVIEVAASIGREGEQPLSMNKWRYCVIEGTRESAKPNPLFGMENSVSVSPRWVEQLAEDVATAGGAQFSRVFIPRTTGDDHQLLADLKKDLMLKKASGKTVMICLSISSDFKFSDTFVDGEDEKYRKYAEKMAAALGDSVDIYQILNEPNIWTSKGLTTKGIRNMPATRYLKWLEAGSKGIRAVNPKAKIAANTNGIHPDYAETLLSNGAAKYIDLFSFHSYRQTPENPPTYESIKSLRTVIDKYAKGMPIVNDEQYFGVRNMLMFTPEDLVDYCADTEEDQAGRILQNYLHHIAAGNVPFSLFSVHRTLYRQGMSNPIYYYEGFSGYRFMSQTLYDIVRTATIDVHPSVRAFIFERKDGTKIVCLNSKMYGVKGGVRNSSAESAYDTNGNPISKQDAFISYTPNYLIFKNSSFDDVAGALKRADFYGFDAAVRANFSADHGTLQMNVENCLNKPIDTIVRVTRLPEGWPAISSLDLKGVKSREIKKFSYPIPESQFQWNKDYSIDYTATVGDTFISKSVRLPSIFARKAKINVDGVLDDWKGATSLTLGEDNLGIDYSEGKLAHKGPKDLSAEVSIAWDDDNVYLALKVNDDVFYPGTGDRAFYLSDSVQLFFDLQNDIGKFYDDNDAVYSIGMDKSGKFVAYLDKNPTGRYVGADNAEKGIDSEVKVVCKTIQGQGYVLELAFPKSTLPYLDFKKGSEFGLSILVNDNDGAGRKQGVTFGPKGSEPTKKPSLWRTVRLTE